MCLLNPLVGCQLNLFFFLSHISPSAAQVNKTTQRAAPPNILVPFVRALTHLQPERPKPEQSTQAPAPTSRKRRVLHLETMLRDAPKPGASV